MNRTKTMFFAFTGQPVEQEEKFIEIQDGYEFWNLKKFKLVEFIDALKSKIPPVNNNVLHNYKIEDSTPASFGITEKQYEQCSWGLLIPDTLDEGGFSDAETMFLLNLYSPNFLYPVFHANDMGITKQKHNKDLTIYFHNQNHSIFNKSDFVTFYKLLFDQSKYGSWHLDRIQSWDKEDWRLFVVALLYFGLADYENVKSPFGWQRESADMATIMEALFTAGDTQNGEVAYRLRKRIAVLLAWQFPQIEKDIKKLYKERSSFVHGSFFQQIAKKSPNAYGNLPTPNFDLLYKQKEYVRFAFVAYLNLARVIKSEGINGITSVISGLEQAIIDITLREQIINETKKLFALMPKSTAL